MQYNWANQEYADTNGCHFQMHRKKQRQFYYYKTIPTPYLLFRFSQPHPHKPTDFSESLLSSLYYIYLLYVQDWFDTSSLYSHGRHNNVLRIRKQHRRSLCSTPLYDRYRWRNEYGSKHKRSRFRGRRQQRQLKSKHKRSRFRGRRQQR